MHSRFSLLPPPYTRAGRALSDLRRLFGFLVALLTLSAACLLRWSAFALGGVAALAALLVLLAFGGAFVGVCAASALIVWGVAIASQKARAFARDFASWARV